MDTKGLKGEFIDIYAIEWLSADDEDSVRLLLGNLLLELLPNREYLQPVGIESVFGLAGRHQRNGRQEDLKVILFVLSFVIANSDFHKSARLILDGDLVNL